MSRAPFVMAKAASAYSRQMPMFDSTIGARFPNPRIEALFGADTMPETADNIAADLGVSRDASDRFALESQEKYEAARKQKGYGAITTEIVDAPEFYFAEDYHQQYLAKNPRGYCGLGGTGVACQIGTGVAA